MQGSGTAGDGGAPSKHFRERTLRTLKLSLGRLWKRRSVTITEYDPTYKVAYLGNVLTGWAKGEGCVEKPLSTLWKNYTGSSKPDVQMKLTVTQAGLKAVTKEHGLTEYWSHRVTYCAAPSSFPRVFCWVYRHEGRKLKQELRCHAVLCPKEAVARRMASQLRAKLAQALSEFKRDKVCRQNARLSLANSVYENPSLPRRKILLSTGSHNYRPPLERSKSAPKLMVIEESLEEEVEDDSDPEHSPRRYQSTRVLNSRLKEVVGSEVYEDDLNEGVLRLHQKMKEFEEVTGSGAASSEKVLNRISKQDVSESSESYKQIMSLINDHQENMKDEREVALGNHRQVRSCFGSVRCQGSQQKRVGWDLNPVPYGNNKYQTERLIIIGDQINGSNNQNVSEEDEQTLNRELESDEGSNSLQSISSSGSSDSSSTVMSRVTEYSSYSSSTKEHTSLPYMYQEAQEAPSPNDSIVDWRPAAGTLKRLHGTKVNLDGLTVALRRSATFPPPTQLSMEALELDSLSEEDDAIEEAGEHEQEEGNVSDESGYAELIDIAAKDEFLKVQHSAMASTHCVQV